MGPRVTWNDSQVRDLRERERDPSSKQLDQKRRGERARTSEAGEQTSRQVESSSDGICRERI